MNRDQALLLKSLRNVNQFLDVNAGRLSAIAQTGAKRSFDARYAELSAHIAAQAASELGAQGATQEQYALRRQLIEAHMAPVSRIARLELARTPQLRAFRMPRGRPTAQTLAARAHGMAAAALPYKDVFIRLGLPDDFDVRLNAAADAMIASIDRRGFHRGTRHGATTGVAVKLTGARRQVMVLDAMIRKELKGDAALLAQWRQAKRVGRIMGAPRRAASNAQA